MAMKNGDSIANDILRMLAEQRRVVLAGWRFHVLHLRAAVARGRRLPAAGPTGDLRREMVRSGDLTPWDGVEGVYRVTTPFADAVPCPDEAVLQEADPFCVMAYGTASALHQLTAELPASLSAWRPPVERGRVPLGTARDDWAVFGGAGRQGVVRVWPAELGGRPVAGYRTSAAGRDVGVVVMHVAGLPVWVTDPERTVLDAVRHPDRAGGVRRAFDLLRAAEDRVDPALLADYVERAGTKVLRQRVGFLLEQVGLTDPKLDAWAKAARRGGSAKLLAGGPFAPTYSPRWQLSVNVPTDLLPDPAAVVR